MKINNETIGISAEVAIADYFGIAINDEYRARANPLIIDSFEEVVIQTFSCKDIPKPIKHVAEDQNPVDFILSGQQTLSVKTSQRLQGKVAPQNVGQPTSETYFHHFQDLYKGINIPSTYEERAGLFKEITIDRIDEVISIYWDNLFDCDYLLHYYNVLDSKSRLSGNISFKIYKQSIGKQFDKEKFTFTQTKTSWNESNTVKYNNVTIGEFQVHNNRNCFKFRFNMDGINKLLANNELL